MAEQRHRVVFEDKAGAVHWFYSDEVQSRWPSLETSKNDGQPPEEELLRLCSGIWVWSYWDCGVFIDNREVEISEYEIFSDSQAANWLLLNRHEPPDCISAAVESKNLSPTGLTVPASEASGRIQVWNQDSSEWRVFDPKGCESWGPVENWESDGFDDGPLWFFSETLYRQPKGGWVLITMREHREAGTVDPTFAIFDAPKAAEWLLTNGFETPSDITGFIAHRILDSSTESGAAKSISTISEESSNENPPTIPIWNRELCQLMFSGNVIREVKRTAHNVMLILDAFQELGWLHRIDDPLPNGSDSQRLRESVRTLNSGLKVIKFKADGSGEGIVWEVT